MNRVSGYLKTILLICVFLLFPGLSTAHAYQDLDHGNINDSDWNALQTIYNQMTPFGQANSGWSSEGRPCDDSWYGVTCENGEVVKLEFDDVNFFCSIPEAITQLSGLREIRMDNMLLRGIIPENLFNLSNLQSVKFSHNLLTGTFPQGSSQTLQRLIIEDNKWTDQKQQELANRPDLSICESVVQYEPERNINMDPGLDGELPGSLGNFPSLYQIDLSGNMLEGNIPAELNYLYSLGSIDLSDNHPNNPLTVTDESLANKLNSIGDQNLAGVLFQEFETSQPEEPTQPQPEDDQLVFQQQTQQAVENEIIQQQMQQANETQIAQQQIQQMVETQIAQQLTQQAYDAMVAQQQTQQAYDESIAQQLTQQAYDAMVAQQQTQQAYDESIAQQLTQQAYDALIAQQLTQQAIETQIALQLTQQAYDVMIAQQQTQQAYDESIAQQQTQQAYDESIAQQTQQAYDESIAQQTQQAYDEMLAQLTQQAYDVMIAQQSQLETIAALPSETPVPSATPTPTETAVVSSPTTEATLTSVPEFVGVNAAEMQNISKIFYAMTPYWRDNSDWFKSYEVCDWDGIDCDEEGYVTSLVLDEENYFCTIPAEITNFSRLKDLTMTNMLLQGTIPADILDMPTLEKLDLSGNLLTGNLPDLISSAALRYLSVADNKLSTDKQARLLSDPNGDYCEAEIVEPLNRLTDPTPGLDDRIPESWFGFGFMEYLDLSGNTLGGVIPPSFAFVAGLDSLNFLNLSNNTATIPLTVTDMTLAEALVMNTGAILDGVTFPSAATLTPTATNTLTATATFTDTPVPTATITSSPEPGLPSSTPLPTATNTPVPTMTATSTFTAIPSPTQVLPSPTPYPIIVVIVTATPKPTTPVWITATPIRWVTATPIPWYTATPIYYWGYRTATPGQYYPPIWTYPTAQPRPTYGYTYPTAVNPTSSSGSTSPVWSTFVPSSSSTPQPTVNPATLFEFNYVSDEMTADNLPMTWKYTGMQDYMINYLTADNTLYPGFAMEWTSAANICNATTCTFDVKSIPEQLLKAGSFSVQLQARDSGGRIYQSDPIGLQVASQPGLQLSATPEASGTPENEPSFIARFFRWLFGPIISLFD